MRVARWMIAVAGLWEAGDVLAFVTPGFGDVPAFVVDHIAVGIVLIISGAAAALTSDPRARRVLGWIAAIAGGWLIVAALLLVSPPGGAGLWNDIVVGAITMSLGIVTARSRPPTDTGARGPA